MKLAFKRLKLYGRGGLIVAVLGVVGLVLLKNRGHAVAFWFFGLTDDQRPVNVVWLILCTSAATLVSWWVLSLGWGLLRDMREVHRLRAISNANKELTQRATDLQERERRVDERLKRALTEEPVADEEEHPQG